MAGAGVDAGEELAFSTCRSGVELAVPFGSLFLPIRLFEVVGCGLKVEPKAGDILVAGVGDGMACD
jgi:hypothetical protein